MKLYKRECSGRATVTGKFKGDDSGSSSYPFTILSHTKGSRGGFPQSYGSRRGDCRKAIAAVNV